MKSLIATIKKWNKTFAPALVWLLLLVFVSTSITPKVSNDELSCLLEMVENTDEECEHLENEVKKEKETFPLLFTFKHNCIALDLYTCTALIEFAESHKLQVPTPPPKA